MSATKICPQCTTQYDDEQRFCPLDGSTLKSLSAAADLVGSVIADRYHVIRKLGEGGMGQVYLAEHVRMGRKSAVKVMNPGMVHDADAISRFNREAANASRITHPNVAAIYDFGETSDGLIYLAMEFVEGEPLTNIIAAAGALPPARAASIVKQTGDALAVAHEFGIVHRDLKPDNIMIARNRDGSDCVKVVDFGIAKAAHVEAQKVTRTGLIVGTPEYMSPEQLAGDSLDGRSDIYSLALVGFAALTGQLPFPSETAQEAMIMRLTDRPRSLAEMKPGIAWPAELQSVMDRALARDAASRYASASQFGHDFATAIERMPDSVARKAHTSIVDAPALPRTKVAPAPTLLPGAIAAGGQRESRGVGRRTIVAMVATGLAAAVIVFTVGRSLSRNDVAGRGAITSPPARPVTDSSAAMANGRAGTEVALPNATAGGNAALGDGRRTAGRPIALTPIGSPQEGSGAKSALSPRAIRTEIDSIRHLALDDATAAEALRRTMAILPRLHDGNDSAEVLLYQSDAYLIQDDSSRSCDALKKIHSRGNSIVRQSVKLVISKC